MERDEVIIESHPLIEIRVKREWCKSCEICVEFCPTNVLAMRNGYPETVNLGACTGCMLCEIRCPDFAITVKDNRPKKEKNK